MWAFNKMNYIKIFQFLLNKPGIRSSTAFIVGYKILISKAVVGNN
jgi:hypothetical protein